jgi:hypothetical protein
MSSQENTNSNGPSTLVSLERYKRNPKVKIIRGSRIKLTPEGVDALARLLLGKLRNCTDDTFRARYLSTD